MEFLSNSLSSSSPPSSSASLGPVDTRLELMNSSPPPPPPSQQCYDSEVSAVAERTTSTSAVVEKEHMFDKVVTPSDVGKLNRLVIPKQHAEKYFPLDSSSNEKGLLLNFEDRTGKQWRFRYSYWNSSQSYVMTKGWSRFVKEKKLDAGDVVSFHRSPTGLFIDWRRRPDHAPPDLFHHGPPPMFHPFSRWGPAALMRPPPPMHYFSPPPSFPYRNSYIPTAGPVYYLRSPAEQSHSPAVMMPRGESVVFDSVPVGPAGAGSSSSSKTLRLFGVNMECHTSDQNNNEECGESNISTTSTTTTPTQPHHPLQLRLYNGTPIPGISTVDYLNNGNSSMTTTFNFDI